MKTRQAARLEAEKELMEETRSPSSGSREPVKVQREPKARVKEQEREAPTKPDAEAFKEAVSKLDEEASELREQIAALVEGCRPNPGRQAELRSQLDAAVRRLEALQQEKQALQAGEMRFDEKLHQQRAKLAEMRRLLPYKDLDKVNELIASLESRLYEESLPRHAEKELLQEASRLSQIRTQIMLLQDAEAKLSEEAADSATNARLAYLDAEIAKEREVKKASAIEYRELLERQMAPPPSISMQRQALQQSINKILKEKQRLQMRLDEQQRRWTAWERQLAKAKEQEEIRKKRQEEEAQRLAEQAQRIAERQERLQKLQEERALREAEMRQQQEKAKVSAAISQEPPHFAEIRLLEQTLTFCHSVLPKAEEDLQEKEPVQYNNPEGSVIIIPKEQRTEDYLVVPIKPRRHEGKVRKKPIVSRFKKSRTEGNQLIMHTPLSFRLFEELRVPAPVCTSELPKLVEVLEERLKLLQDEVAEWEIRRKELLDRRLAQDLEKARLAAEAREREAERWRAQTMSRVQEAMDALMSSREEQSEEIGDEAWDADERLVDELKAAVLSANSAGVSKAAQAPAKNLLARFDRRAAKAKLLEALQNLEEWFKKSDQEDFSADDAWTKELKCRKEVVARALKSAQSSGVDAAVIEAAREQMEKAQGGAKKGADDGPSPENAPEEAAEEAEATNPGQCTEEPKEDFMPTMTFGDDEDDVIFDLGM